MCKTPAYSSPAKQPLRHTQMLVSPRGRLDARPKSTTPSPRGRQAILEGQAPATASKAAKSPDADVEANCTSESQPLLHKHQPSGLSAFAATLVSITVWYASNIGLLLMNKYLLSNYGFKKPVFLTLCHMLACTGMSMLADWGGLVPSQPIKSRAQLSKVCTLAIVFALTVVLGNVALKFIPVSFSQAIGATTPAFTAALAFFLLGTVESATVYATLIPVVVGIVIATNAEPSFNMMGFMAAVLATAARAFKSVLQGVLLADQSEKLDSMNLLRYMAPITVAVLVPATLILEPSVFKQLQGESYGFYGVLVLNAALAYFVNLTNFLVTRYTSALTLQVLGNAKGVVAVVVSIMIFKNPFSSAGILGYAITVSGVGTYAYAKRRAAGAAAAPK